MDFAVTSKTITGGAWLSVSPSQGSATGALPVSLTVTANPAGLNPGTYVGSVSVADADGATTLPILITMTVSASGQSIRLSQTGLTFTAVVNGGPAPPQSFAVINTGQGAVQFTAATIIAPGSPNWLSVTPSSGSSDVSQPVPILSVSVNPAGLTAGSYYGRIQVRSPSADNSPQELTVVLNLLPDGTDPGPLVQPAGLVFTGVSGGSDPASQTVLVTNLTASPISFGSGVATLDGGKYIAYQPANAMVAPGSVRLVVQPTFAGLSAGIYRGAITLVFSNGSIRTVSILIVIAPAGTTTGAARAAAGCTPSRLLPLLTSLGDQFNVPASFPTSIEVRVVDDCGRPSATGSVVSTFSNGDPALPLISLRDGRWSGAWVSRNTAQRQVSITVTAENPQLGLRGTVQATGGLSGDNRPPVIGAGGVVSASSLVGLAALAPGSMVSIFGVKLSDGTAVAQTLPLDTQLAGTTVLVAGKSVPLLFSSDGQVNALLPFDIPVNARIQMLVSRGSQISVPEELYIAPAQPGVYTTNGSGGGQGDIFSATSGKLVDSTAPARVGDVLVIYCSGLGPVDQPVADGAPAPTSPLARTVNPVNLTIGGVTANVLFAGLAPGFSGLYQVNAVVPEGVPAGDQTPLVITVAGQASRPVTMATR